MLKTIAVLIIVGGIGYWYWTGPYEKNLQSASSEEEQLKKNAQIIERCLNRESSMNTAAVMEGVGGIAEDSKSLCAQKHGLYFAEGQWREIDLDDGVY